MQNNFLSRLIKEFEKLNKVPKFQLERAISPLLGIFIKEIINKKFDLNVSVSIPEFPLKIKDGFQSTNIDWLLFDRMNKIIYFLELKTERLSYSVDQSGIYKRLKKSIDDAADASLLKSELDLIISRSNRKKKYNTIIDILHEKQVNLSDYGAAKIIYLAPALPPCSKEIYYDHILLFNELPAKINTKYFQEWHQLRKFLKTLSTQYVAK